jgi:hypothetical protein
LTTKSKPPAERSVGQNTQYKHQNIKQPAARSAGYNTQYKHSINHIKQPATERSVAGHNKQHKHLITNRHNVQQVRLNTAAAQHGASGKTNNRLLNVEHHVKPLIIHYVS